MASSAKIESVSWSADVERILARACDRTDPDDPGIDVTFYRDLVKAGRAYTLGLVDDAGEILAAAVYTIDAGAVGLEFVILACASEDPRAALIEDHLSGLEYLAVALGCKSVRFHTRRRGLVDRMSDRGYRPSEYVYRKAIGRPAADPIRYECRAQEQITMGGGGGSSSSETNQTDERIAADSSVVADDGATINIDVEDISPEVVKEVGEFANRVFDFAETERDASRQVQQQALDRAFDSTNAGVQELLGNMIKLGAGATAAYAAIRYGPDLVKSFKG